MTARSRTETGMQERLQDSIPPPIHPDSPAPNVPTKVPLVQAANESLRISLNGLSEIVEELLKRIQPILSQTLPEPCQSGVGEKNSHRIPLLAETIQNFDADVCRVKDMLQDALCRIEI